MSEPNHNVSNEGGLATLFYRDRRLLSLAICLIVVAGLAALMALPRMEDPVLTERAATINTRYPGASAERVEALVTEKIESKVQEIEEIKELRSVSRDGISTITIELRDSVLRGESEEVWSRIRDKLADAEPLLPADAAEPEFDQLKITAYALIVALVWDRDDAPNYAILRRHAEQLDDRLREVAGTKEVDMFGDPSEEVVVTVEQQDLIQRQLSITDVAAQLVASDAKVSAGLQRGQRGDFLMEVEGEFDSLQRIRNTPIQFGAAGQAVTVGDLADVGKSIRQPVSSLAIIDGRPGISLAVIVSPSQRVDRWFDEARRVLVDFESQLPRGVRQAITFEQDTYVRGRLATLSNNLLVGAVAIVLVIGLMMGWRSALVVGLALPLSSLMVLAGLNGLGIPLHQMSITGLIIALGLLIDNAIVVVDEVGQKMKEGEQPITAVRLSVSHLAIPLFGSTMTTALSFAPIALMPGPAGEFVSSIAISVLLAVFSSFLLAVTVTPALAAILTSGAANREGGWLTRGLGSEVVSRTYRAGLSYVFRHPWLGVGGSLVLPTLGFVLGSTLTEQFFPPAERDQLNLQMEMPASASIESTQRVVRQARELLLQFDAVSSVDWYVGQSAPSFYYNMLANRFNVAPYAQALVQLNTAVGTRELIHGLQAKLDRELPEARFLVRQLEQGPPFEAPIELRLFGPDLDRLRELGNQVRRVLSATPDVVHVITDLDQTLPTLSVDVDEEQARIAGLTHIEIARQLEASLEGAVGGSVLESTEELPVRIRCANDVRSDLDQIASLELLSVADAEGRRRAIPVSAVADIKLQSKVSSIRRFDTQRINEVRAYITAGKLPADVLADFRHRFGAVDFRLPPGYRLEYAGEGSKRDEAVGNLMSSVGVLFVCMVATLVLSFSSYRIAGIVGIVAVLSVGLGLGSLALFGYPFGFMAIVGTMGLIGVAINDTIVVLAAIRGDRAAAAGNSEAITDVVLRSTRHVLATTLTTIVGFIPLIVEGGGFWPPLATSIAGGVAGATLLALFFGPSVYILVMCPKRVAASTTVRAEVPESLAVAQVA